MRKPRLPGNDPRTLARDIPGLLDTLFPHLVPGVVAHLNRQASSQPGCTPVLLDEVQASPLARAMLFELAVATAEQLLVSVDVQPDWEAALAVAVRRQKRHFDVKEPKSLAEVDKQIALRVARNLVLSLKAEQEKLSAQHLILAPAIPGYQWIASGVGDFALDTRIIEVKCTNRKFSAADYRQVLMYWLLSYMAAVESRAGEWSHVILMNPRLGHTLTLSFNALIQLLGGGRSKVELLQLFASIIDERRIQKRD